MLFVFGGVKMSFLVQKNASFDFSGRQQQLVNFGNGHKSKKALINSRGLTFPKNERTRR